MMRRIATWALGCAMLGGAMASESTPFAVRPLELGSGDTWIGDAICYGPYRDGQRPGQGSPSMEQLREDVRILARHWKLLRIYGASEFAENLIHAIREEDVDLRLLLGAWISADEPEDNRIEIEAAIRLANEYPDQVVAVAVGNETQVSWSGHRCSPQMLLEALREVRSRVTVPVTTADDHDFWVLPESRSIAAEIDFISYHAHPMWNGILLDDALEWLGAETQKLRALHPDRPLLLAETGWATQVSTQGEQAKLIRARAGEAEQLRFLDAVRGWAAAEQVPTFWFEAFDENWKGDDDPTHVEKHWGLFHANRSPKQAMAAGSER